MRHVTTHRHIDAPILTTARIRRCIGSLALIGFLFSSIAGACQICIPVPQKTLADRLLEADAVMLAREDPDRPYHFRSIEVLAGAVGDKPIDAFLNSQARRILAAYPQRAMVLARKRGRDSWTTLGIADAELDRVVRLVIAHADEWTPLETANSRRLEVFAKLLGHEDSRLHELAYLEIGRAPYGVIREIAGRVSVKSVRAMLDDPRYLEWRSLAVLMLAQTRDPDDMARIRETFERKQRMHSALNLAAWATAYIAVEGPAAIEHIEQIYLSRPDRSPDELREILKALSTQANDDPQLRHAIAAAYHTLIDVHPGLASEIARDLIAWRRWDFVEQVERARTLKGDDDPLGTHALNLYLRMAAARAGTGRGGHGAKTAASEARGGVR